MPDSFLQLHRFSSDRGLKLKMTELLSISYADNMPNQLIFDSLGH